MALNFLFFSLQNHCVVFRFCLAFEASVYGPLGSLQLRRMMGQQTPAARLVAAAQNRNKGRAPTVTRALHSKTSHFGLIPRLSSPEF